MKPLLVATAVAALTAGIANAQYKNAAPPPPSARAVPSTQTGPSPIRITTTQTDTAAVANELSKAPRISRDQAMRMIKEKKAVYIDVRSKDAYDQSHIPGAISIPLSELPNRLKEIPLNKFLITYCA